MIASSPPWVVFVALGCGAGALFFLGLKHTVRRVLGTGAIWPIGLLYLARFGLILALLYWAAQVSAGSLLGATAGFTLAGIGASWKERGEHE